MRSGSEQPEQSGYQRLHALADGGMGKVELAIRQDGSFRRLYAVKRLHEQFRNDDYFRRMFLDEARVAGLIRHANVVSVLDVGEDVDGPFLVMDFVQGVPLSRLIANEAVIEIQVALRVIRDIAMGLDAAHELRDHDGRLLGVVHRDISPQNILISFDGSAQLTDFGIAKALGASTRTVTGVVKGKFGYMSPEQLSYGDVDRRSDLFALGVVLYEAIAGKRLYAGGESHAPRRILREAPPDITDERANVPDAIVELLFSMLAKDPEERPTTAASVAEALELILATMVAEEGVRTLQEHMRLHFSDEETQSRARTADAIERVRREPNVVPSALMHAFSTPTSLTPVTLPPPRQNGFSLKYVAVGIVGLSVAAWFAFGFPETEQEVEVEASVNVAPVPEETEPEEAVSEDTPLAVIPTAATPPIIEAADSSAEAEAGATPMSSPRASRRRPRRPSPMDTSTMDPLPNGTNAMAHVPLITIDGELER